MTCPSLTRGGSVAQEPGRNAALHPRSQFIATPNIHTPNSTPSDFLCHVTFWAALRGMLPTTAAVNACSCGIFILSLAIFGFQSNGTLVLVNDTSLAATIIACLSSGAALLFGLLYIALDRLAYRDIHEPAYQSSFYFISLMIYATSCASLALAGVSFSIFIIRVAWKTTPRVSGPLFAVYGCISLVLFLLFLAYRPLRIVPSPQQLEMDPAV